MMVLAIHATQLNQADAGLPLFADHGRPGDLLPSASKAVEYYIDYRENLIPGFKFDDAEWIARGVDASRIGYVEDLPVSVLGHDGLPPRSTSRSALSR